MTQKSKASNQLKKLKKQFDDVFSFGRQLFSNWLLWLFLILDIIALIVQYIDQRFQLPQYVYIVLALIGFFWAGFKVYQELLSKYNALVNDPSRKIIEPKTSLSITPLESNEYSYKIRGPYLESEIGLMMYEFQRDEVDARYENGILYINNVVQYELPASLLFINLRIINDGNTPLDILAILPSCDYSKSPFLIYSKRIVSEEEEILYPKHLEPNEILICQIEYKVGKIDGTDAQFAASLRNIHHELSYSVSMDVLDQIGGRKKITLSSKISIRPLVDLYFTQWQTYRQNELLRKRFENGQVNLLV